MEIRDFRADAVLGQRVFDLPGDVAIDEAQPVRQQADQDQGDHAGRDNDSRDYCVPPREASETSAGRAHAAGWLLFAARRFGWVIVMVIHRHWRSPGPRADFSELRPIDGSHNFQMFEGEPRKANARS